MMSDNFDKEAFEKLSPEEQKVVLEILKQYAETGKSALMEDLSSADWKEIPVDIETFLTDDNYLGKAWKDAGGNFKMYPFWLEQMKKLFPDNMTTAYATLLESGARGIGKSEVACGAVGAYLMYRVLCMKNPLEYYGLKPTEKICFAFMNIKLDLAEGIANSKFQKTVQLSPWFMSKGFMTQRKNLPYWLPPDPVEIIIGSKSDDVIGKPIFYAFFDEISFIQNQDIDKQKKKAQDMIDTAVGGMFTRFIKNGQNPTMLVVASSKRSEQSFMEEYIKKLSTTEGHSTLVVDKPVWEVKPKGTYSDETFYVGLGNKFLASIVIEDDSPESLAAYKGKGYKLIEVPTDFKAKFLEDIERNLCDFAGISSSSMNKYMSAEIVKQAEVEDWNNPFIQDVLEVGNNQEDMAQYYHFFNMDEVPAEMLEMPLFVHLDMSISGDMTGIAGVWISGKKPSTSEFDTGKDLSFRLAFSVSIKAPKGYQISFEKNRNFIRWLRETGFNVKEVTSDTFQSYDLRQQLSAEGFKCNALSVDRTDTDKICKPYQFLKNAVYERRFKMYHSERLFDEFVDVERNIVNGKVDHTPKGHKDALDAVCGATFTASKYAEEFAYDYGESVEASVEISLESNSATDIRTQFVSDFEKELASMSGSYAPYDSRKNHHISKTTTESNVDDDIDTGPIDFSGGMLLF